MNSITYLTLDLQAPNFAVMASAKQNDTLGRQIAATLRDGSASFDATGLLCEIRYAKPDGTVGFYDTLEDDETPAYTIDGNVITFTLAEQMLTVAGAVYVDVNFYAATGEKLTAFTFVLQVEASVLADGTIVSSDYFNVLTATLAEAAEIAANLPIPSESTPIPDSASGSAGTGNGFARGNHSHPINVATSGTPANLGTAANGTSAYYARQDHVHEKPTYTAADVGAVSTDDVKYKIFNTVSDIGLTPTSATIADAFAALPDGAILICDASDFDAEEVPSLGQVEMQKISSSRCPIWFHGTTVLAGDWRMFISSGTPSGTWVRDDLAVDSGNPSASSGTLVSGANVRRSGNTVVLNYGATGVNVPTSLTKIGSIPARFAPSDTTFGVAIIGFGDGQCYADVTTGGDIRIRGSSAQTGVGVRLQLTWIQ